MDLKKLKKQAEAEIAAEKAEKAKEIIKQVIRKIDAAKLVVRNLELELADAYADLGSRS